mgnify:CR=1 FL=1|tara:strand:+ start:1488 stop:1673 length:186 start_codon:yes stop_codon:yes gene_type:complete
MADPKPPDSKGVVDESLKQRLKRQPQRQEIESPSTLGGDASVPDEGDHGIELRGQSMRGDQ